MQCRAESFIELLLGRQLLTARMASLLVPLQVWSSQSKADSLHVTTFCCEKACVALVELALMGKVKP